ncbi:MAG TPA: hypothetical protein VG365_08225 [Solirubrobacteraceae bacterium]|nr:hypothetical protein [Solirubrobacteraceae bacterium]
MVVLGVTTVAASAAQASTVPLASATSSQFYSWCGKSTLNSILPDATPPAKPTSCWVYSAAGSVSSLTATFGSHAAGRMTVSVYASNGTRPFTLALHINGTTVDTENAAQSHQGWMSFPAQTVTASDQVQVVANAGWPGSNYAQIASVHGDLAPWASPPWSQFGTPGNWATTPVPANIVTDPGSAPDGLPLGTEVPREIAGQAQADSYVNMWAYTEPTYYEPLSTPPQPVRLCRSSNNCVPNWGAPTDDLWKAAMGLPNNAVPNRTTGQCASNCTYTGGGIAVTATVAPQPDTDKSAIICLGGGDSRDPPWTLKNPDGTPFVRPDGQQIQGNCWDLWGLQTDPTYNPNLPVSPSNTKYMIAWGARRTGFLTQLTSTPDNTYGHQLDTLSGQYCPRTAAGEWKCGGMTDTLAAQWFGPDVLRPGAADSTTYDFGWGVTATELPMMTDVVQQHDCTNILNGTASDFGHAIGVQVRYSRFIGNGLHVAWWPANASDGNNGMMATVEGMRLYLPSSVAMPSGLSAAAQAFFRTVQKYGIVVDDQTGGGPGIAANPNGSYAYGGALNIRVEQGTSTSPCGQLDMSSALSGIPWSALMLIKQGWDGNPNPTS